MTFLIKENMNQYQSELPSYMIRFQSSLETKDQVLDLSTKKSKKMKLVSKNQQETKSKEKNKREV